MCYYQEVHNVALSPFSLVAGSRDRQAEEPFLRESEHQQKIQSEREATLEEISPLEEEEEKKKSSVCELIFFSIRSSDYFLITYYLYIKLYNNYSIYAYIIF